MVPDSLRGVRRLARAVNRRELSAEEIARASLAAIDRIDRDVRAFTALDPERTIAKARAFDRRIAAGAPGGALAGVPLAVKDLCDVEGMPSSYGTPAIPARRAERDATCVSLLRAAGALVVGKTRTSELAWRGDTPPTLNPRYPDLVPGGSSGGSGAAVAASLVPLALGTDTGGSVRWPAAMCGVVGMKPTYGAVSLGGVLPCSWALDHVGPLAASCEDASAALAALVRHDPRDPASAPAPVLDSLRTRLALPPAAALRGLRLAVVDEPLFAIADDGAAAAFEATIRLIEAAGVSILRTRLPDARFVPPAITALSLAEGVVFSRALRERPAELSEEVRAQLQLAHALPASLVVRAQQVRRLLSRRVSELFREARLDALLVPATTGPPVARSSVDAEIPLPDGTTGSALGWSVRTFYLANLTGQPALVLPASGSGRPLSIQLLGRPFADDRLLALGGALERVLPGPVA
jgi:aspartyl-tRNA(Asn)/glutamyl-tRNA(Gln) amidotransferase subunit A